MTDAPNGVRGSARIHLRELKLSRHHALSKTPSTREGDVMERREFLKIALGVAAGAAALAASARAAPLLPQPFNEDGKIPAGHEAYPAVTSEDETNRLAPEEVRWGRGGHRG
ncbi:MAG TPA: twin-arginine translocation signal domain-containing protein, partial [Bradyrhizobium sp.]|nr:twin-arginine translocation signal domain-containing protein [Bradyrhizobium sp.]